MSDSDVATRSRQDDARHVLTWAHEVRSGMKGMFPISQNEGLNVCPLPASPSTSLSDSRDLSSRPQLSFPPTRAD
jgi:hypothetical protein